MAHMLFALSLLGFVLSPIVSLAQIKSELIVEGLTSPVYLTAPEGDAERLFILGRFGTIQIFKDGALLPEPFLDITGLVEADENLEMGLLGLTFHPEYDTNGYFYVYYTTGPADRASVIHRFSVSANPDSADAASLHPIFRMPQNSPQHVGGTVLFGPDDQLYLGLGDDNATGTVIQDPQNLIGKMIRLDPDGDDFPADPVQNYAIPFDNPFVDSTTVRDEIWAFGLRNPYRFSFDQVTGDLYIGDVGEETREEIDFQPAGSPGGENYGWKRMEGTGCYVPPVGCDTGLLTYPIHEYLHVPPCNSVTGGVVYRGSEIPWIQGHYFFADFCRQPPDNIWSFRVEADSVTEFTQRSDLQPSDRDLRWIVAVAEDGVGEMYLIEKGQDGKIYKVVPDPAVAVNEPPRSSFLVLTPGHPNPFTRSTQFGVQLERAAQLDVSVYSATGRLVRRIYQGPAEAGYRPFEWDGTAQGSRAAAGVYFIRTVADGRAGMTRITLLR